MARIAFIWHGVANLGDHAQEYRKVVFFEEEATVGMLLDFLTSKDGTLELTEQVQVPEPESVRDQRPF